jgi:DNA (cytosine-5)-methyltransferase 1
MAVEEVFGGTTAWVSDVDPGANKILAHRWPATPNIGDLTVADWDQVEPVDILCGGYPCQPFSNAGLRKGTDDERHLWPFIAGALRVLRPRIAIFENVAGHLRLGFDTVLADLAALGFDAEWALVRAEEVGAPHRRERLFIYATATDAGRLEPQRRGVAGVLGGPTPTEPGEGGQRERPRHAAGDRGETAADATDLRHDGLGRTRGGRPGSADSGIAAADVDGSRRGPEQPDVPAGQPDAAWGSFAPAIARWEATLGRPAPWATDDCGRLNPHLVEWMMGLPAGHVTAVPGMTRTQQLKALGNGVVPVQAAAAIRLLHARAERLAVAS